ncbi:MAG: MMPL family transporter [Phycisphaerae bacterium]|nr:MMPL family transporter [Phycisphaerae bacterium]
MTLIIAALLCVVSVGITIGGLTFRSDRSDLIDPSLSWQRRYTEYRAKFPRWDDVAVVIDLGESAESRERGGAFIAALESRLKTSEKFSAVTAGFSRSEAPLSLILTQPTGRVKEVVDRLVEASPVLAATSLDGLLGLSQLGGGALSPPQRDGLRGLLERTFAAGSARGGSVLGMDSSRGIERLVSTTGRLATILVSLRKPTIEEIANGGAEVGVDGRGGAIRALRAEIMDLKGSDPAFSKVEVGVTGVPVLESDETTLSLRDATVASVLSLALIALLMLIAYRGVIVPVCAVVSLLIGMAWAFAWATLAVGHLQLLSVTFASMLLGLGIDVAIHIIARLELLHADHDHLGDAIAEAFRGVGPGILTASFTVAAASASMALTSFSGVAEMGIIAAGGIVLCTLSIMCCLPAMFMLMPRPEQRLRSHNGGVSRPYMGSLGLAFHRHPAPVLVAAGALFAGIGWLATGTRYDPDLQKLMPSTTESVVWQQRLESDDEKSVWHAVVLAHTLDEARGLTDRLRALDVVSDVGGIGMLLPREAELLEKRALLSKIPDASSLAVSSASSPSPPSATQIDRVRTTAASLEARWREHDPALAAAALAVSRMDDDQVDRAMATYHTDRRSLIAQINGLRSAVPATPDELPRALRELMVGTDGSLLLRVYPKSDPTGGSVLAPERLSSFASAVLGVAPNATGPAVQIYESSRLITRAYLQAGLYALAAIVVLLFLDFGLSVRGLGDTMCALLPVALGGVMMLAVMSLAGVPLNFANMIVLPLLIGIGVGCGVHAVRRWRLQPNDHPLGLAGGSGRAITLTTLTTVFGFATMMTGQHRGIWSLGLVMSVGLLAVWAVTVLVLPAVLRLRRV